MEETKEQIINLIKKQDYGNVIDLFEEIDETTIQEIIQNISSTIQYLGNYLIMLQFYANYIIFLLFCKPYNQRKYRQYVSSKCRQFFYLFF